MADTTETEASVESDEYDKNWLSKLVMDILNREYKLFDLFIGTVAAWTTVVISLLSFIFFLVAYCTADWSKVEHENSVGDVIVRYIGLWKECTNYGGCTSDMSVNTDAFRSCQAFATIALIVIASSVVFSGAYICWDRLQRHPMLALAITVSKGISAFSLLLLISIWADSWYKPNYDSPGYHRSLNYSYGFAVTTFVTEIFGLLFAAVEYYQAWRDDKKMMGKLVPDAERDNGNSMAGEDGYEATQVSTGGGGTGWGELPDKQKNSGADWGELPDLKHRSNSGGWGEMPDLKHNPGRAGWNELPDNQCDQEVARYSGGDSPITVSPGNLYQYNPERGRTTPLNEFQKYYMEQSSENIAQKPLTTGNSNQSRIQRPNSISNQSLTGPYVSVNPTGATYDKRNRNEKESAYETIGDVGSYGNSVHQPYRNARNIESNVRGQGQTRSRADMGSADAVDVHKRKERRKQSDYENYGGERVNSTHDKDRHISVHNDVDKNPYVNKADIEARYDNRQHHDHNRGTRPKYDIDMDRSYQHHNHRYDNEANYPRHGYRDHAQPVSAHKGNYPITEESIRHDQKPRTVPDNRNEYYDPQSRAHAQARDHYQNQGKRVTNNPQSPHHSSVYDSQTLVAANNPAESTQHRENNPVAPSRRKRSPRKPTTNYDQHNGHDALQVSVNPTSGYSVAFNQPTDPKSPMSDSFI